MVNKRIEKIIANYFDDKISNEEAKELIAWIENGNRDIFNEYVTYNFNIEQLKLIKNNNQDSSWERIAAKIGYQDATKVIPFYKRNFFRYAVAASIVLLISFTFIFNKDKGPIGDPTIVDTNTIVPGTDKATLTLEDGSVVALEKGNAYQTQNADSNGEQIIYTGGAGKSKEITYNYLTIPRGGQFFIKLSDGTKVWLNSESQLKYPVNFIEGETRQVELVYGEAFFEVSPSTDHDGAKFIVINQSQEVEVLGTQFNIKAYKDETNIYTTLVEGKVLVNTEDTSQELKPSEQANLNAQGGTMSVSKVNVYNEISWRDGVFSFRRKPLAEIMKVLSRWYDIDVIYVNKEVKKAGFNGVLDKGQDIEEILEVIKNFGIIKAYEINNKTVILK